MNSDGTIVAIGAIYNGSNSGHVRVYGYVINAWEQLVSDIDGEAPGDKSGYSVSMNSDGTIVAIGAIYNDSNDIDGNVINDSGHVRVYGYVNNAWEKIGNDIDGEAPGDYSGVSVSMNSDGTIVAIGAIYNNANGINPGHVNSGHVRVYNITMPSVTQVPICFPAGTPVLTNVGNIDIEKINPDKHTINGNKIIAITQTKPLHKHIVCFEQDSLSKNIPCQQNLCSMEHKVFYKGEMINASNIVNLCENVTLVPYNGETLFNVLLEKYDKMTINNLICETLHPDNILANIITMKDGQQINKTLQDLTRIFKEQNVQEYIKLLDSL
jgi:hypothetical protein